MSDQTINKVLFTIVLVSFVGFAVWFYSLTETTKRADAEVIKAVKEVEKSVKDTAEKVRQYSEAILISEENAKKAAIEAQRIKLEIEELQKQQLINKIVKKHKVKYSLAEKVVNLAIKYEKPVFPTKYDILAIIAIESDFDPKAKSNLKVDPATGLMQVRPMMWKIKHSALKTIDGQIQHGVDILAHYHELLNDRNSTVEAYNIGFRAFKRGDENKEYVGRFNRALTSLKM